MEMRGVAGILLGVGALGACLISETPGDPPKPQSRRPAILHDQVAPKLTEPITVILGNTELRVPVEADPQAKLVWRLFIDFDPVNGGVIINEGEFQPDQTQSPMRLVIVPLANVDALDPTICHSLTLRVAVAFSTLSNWTPIAPGGDDATWFYRPNGNQAACPGYDAGTFADAAAFDAGAE